MNAIIFSYLFLTIEGIAGWFALDQMLEANAERTTRKIRMVCWTLVSMILSICQFFVNIHSMFAYLRNLIYFCVFLVIFRYFYIDPLWRRALALIIIMFSTAFADVTVFITPVFVDREIFFQLDYSTPEMAFGLAVACMIMIPVYGIVTYFWKKYFHPGDVGNLKFFFLFYFALQFCEILLFMRAIMTDSLNSSVGVLFFSSILSNVIVLVIVFRQTEKNSLEERLTESKKISALGQKSLQEVEKRRGELEKISQQNVESLNEIQRFLNRGETAEATRVLEELSQKIQNTKEYPFCEIPIINVILSEKQKECERLKIRFDADLRFPQEQQIKQMDLCSVFANLLDNAIRACKKESEFRKDPYIVLEAGVFGEYLIIKCENSLMEAPGKIPEGHGLGHKILRDIAKRYQGNFYTEYDAQKQQFYAQITLRFR